MNGDQRKRLKAAEAKLKSIDSKIDWILKSSKTPRSDVEYELDKFRTGVDYAGLARELDANTKAIWRILKLLGQDTPFDHIAARKKIEQLTSDFKDSTDDFFRSLSAKYMYIATTASGIRREFKSRLKAFDAESNPTDEKNREFADFLKPLLAERDKELSVHDTSIRNAGKKVTAAVKVYADYVRSLKMTSKDLKLILTLLKKVDLCIKNWKPP